MKYCPDRKSFLISSQRGSLGSVALAGAFLFAASTASLSAQTDYTWNAQAADWNDAAHWTPGGGPPTVSDNVIMNPNTTINAMTNTSSFTMNNFTLDGGSQFTQIGVGAAGSPISFNVNGDMTHTGTGSLVLFRGSTGSELTNVLSVNIQGNFSTSGGQVIQFGQHRTDNARYNYALNGLNISGTTTINDGGTVQIYTNGATATFGEVSMATTGAQNTFLMNNGSLTDDFGSQFSGSRTVQIAGLSGGTDGSQVSASDATKSNGAVTLQLTGSGNYEFFGRINNRTDNSIQGSIVTVEKTGSGTQILSNSSASGYSGETTVSNGTLIVNGELARTPLITVASGATFGGSGSATWVGGPTLNLDVDSNFIFDPLSLVGDAAFQTFNVANVTFAGTGLFSLDNLVNADGSGIAWSTIADGTYTLIDGVVSDFATWVDSATFDIGGGRSAYFQEGSLQLVVVPEPGTYALFGGLLALGLVTLRRRRS